LHALAHSHGALQHGGRWQEAAVHAPSTPRVAVLVPRVASRAMARPGTYMQVSPVSRVANAVPGPSNQAFAGGRSAATSFFSFFLGSSSALSLPSAACRRAARGCMRAAAPVRLHAKAWTSLHPRAAPRVPRQNTVWLQCHDKYHSKRGATRRELQKPWCLKWHPSQLIGSQNAPRAGSLQRFPSQKGQLKTALWHTQND